MKKTELNEIKKLEIKALKERAKKLRTEIASLVIKKNTKQLKDLRSIFTKRRDLAQTLTILNQRLTLETLERNQNAKK